MKEGRIIKALSGFYYVESNEKVYACKGRGVFRNKKITPLVGDFVLFDQTNDNEGYIKDVKTRKNELVRPPIANVSQSLIVSAVTHPSFSTLLLDRFLVIVESKQIKPMIVITKSDLATSEELKKVHEYKQDYEQLGYPVELLSLKTKRNLNKIIHFLKNEVTVLMGQSGVGKSTLLNTIDPRFLIKTAEISTSLGRGKHTTRHVELHKINGGLVADTPGFSSIDFLGIEVENLSACFIEMKAISDNCKFRSCLHDKEPQCAVKKAVESNHIKRYRYDHYLLFLQEILSRKPRYS